MNSFDLLPDKALPQQKKRATIAYDKSKKLEVLDENKEKEAEKNVKDLNAEEKELAERKKKEEREERRKEKKKQIEAYEKEKAKTKAPIPYTDPFNTFSAEVPLLRENFAMSEESQLLSIDEVNESILVPGDINSSGQKGKKIKASDTTEDKTKPSDPPNLGARSKTMMPKSSGKTEKTENKEKKSRPTFERAKTDMPQNKPKSKACIVM